MNSVVRWNPIRNFVSVQDELERVFGRTWQTDDNGARCGRRRWTSRSSPIAHAASRAAGSEARGHQDHARGQHPSIRGEKTRTEEQKTRPTTGWSASMGRSSARSR